MDFSFQPEITKDLLLKYNNEETYMSYYLGIPIKKGLFISPLRVDHKPTCSFFKGRQLYFKDFATGECLSFENVVMKKFGCNYYEALVIIAKDFGIIKNHNYKTAKIIKQETFKKDKKTIIQIEAKSFTNDELKWWEQFGVNKSVLIKYRVYSCKTVFLNGKIESVYDPKCPSYGYYFGNSEDGRELWKIYYPFRKTFRFLGNIKTTTIQGYTQLPKKSKLLVITKSLKDVMVLYNLGIAAIAPQSETQFIEDQVLEDLRKRFKHIVLVFDNDQTGVEFTNKIKHKYSWITPMIIPRRYKAKDISDFYKMYGKDKTITLIKEGINYLKQWLKSS